MTMPPLKSSASLFRLSLSTFIQHFISKFTSGDIYINQAFLNQLQELLQYVPINVLDSAVSTFVSEYVKMRRTSCKTIYEFFIRHVLLMVAVPRLNVLMLGKLVRLGKIDDRELDTFIDTFVQVAPRLNYLVKLSLPTHRFESTLPVCNDSIMESIGLHCHNLRALDVSCNNLVSDKGLRCLIPHYTDGKGCPYLEEIFLYESSVSNEGVCDILEHLEYIRHIGYEEVGSVLNLINLKMSNNNSTSKTFKLTHVDNSGSYYVTHKLLFHRKLSCTVNKLCPRLENLKIRVTDFDVARMDLFPGLASIKLIYNVGIPTSPGEGTANFFLQSGHQLTTVSIVCNFFHAEQFVTIGQSCPNLVHFWVKCNNLVCNEGISECIPKTGIDYSYIETFSLRVGQTESHEGLLPSCIVQYILRNTNALNKLRIIYKSPSLTDLWLSSIFNSITTSELVTVMIAIPGINEYYGSLDLSINSVYHIMNCCPKLVSLGNLIVWKVNFEEYLEVKRTIDDNNFDLKIIYCRFRGR